MYIYTMQDPDLYCYSLPYFVDYDPDHTQRGHCIEPLNTVENAGSRVEDGGITVEEWWEMVQLSIVASVEHRV
jgi:hypothetical protein